MERETKMEHHEKWYDKAHKVYEEVVACYEYPDWQQGVVEIMDFAKEYAAINSQTTTSIINEAITTVIKIQKQTDINHPNFTEINYVKLLLEKIIKEQKK